MTGTILKTQTQEAQTALTPAPQSTEAARHPVVPDFIRFKMHRLGERLDHVQPFSTAYARVLQKLKLAPAPMPEPVRPNLGRARSSSLPGTRPQQAMAAPHAKANHSVGDTAPPKQHCSNTQCSATVAEPS